MNYLLISGINDKYINIFKKFLNSIKDNYEKDNFIVYDLGLNKDNLIELNNLSKIYFFKIKKFNFDIYPPHCNLNNNTYKNNTYAWKPIIIYNECLLNKNKNIIWIDTKSIFNNNSLNLICDEIEKYGAWINISNKPKEYFTINFIHKKVRQYFNLNENDYKNNIEMKFAGIIGFNYSKEITKKILDDWYKYSLIKDAIAPEGSNRDNHRQDQALLSILIFQKGLQNHFPNNRCGVKVHINVN